MVGVLDSGLNSPALAGALHDIPSKGVHIEIPLVSSCYVNQDKHWPDGLLGSSVFYTCQFFLGQRREIFILRVLGFPEMTRPFPKIPEDVRSIPKTFRTYPEHIPKTCFAKHDHILNAFLVKTLRFRGKYRHKLSLHGAFVSYIRLSSHIFGKCAIYGCNSSHFSTRREKLDQKRELA